MPLHPAGLADRVANRPKLRVIRIGRALALFPAFPGDGVETLEGFCHALGNSLTFEFVVRTDPPGEFAGGFLHALEPPLLKIRPCAGEAGDDERQQQATQYDQNIHSPKPHFGPKHPFEPIAPRQI
jgi:hypothetical protein